MRPIQPLVRLPHSHIDPKWLSTVERATRTPPRESTNGSRPHSQRNRIAPGKSASEYQFLRRFSRRCIRLQADVIINRIVKTLFAPEVSLRRLN
jgi:hypothetical protein